MRREIDLWATIILQELQSLGIINKQDSVSVAGHLLLIIALGASLKLIRWHECDFALDQNFE